MTNAFYRCIFAMKQIIEIMKTKVIIMVLIISGLYLLTPMDGRSQELLFRVHSAEIVAEMPALSCFRPTFAGFHFRNDFGMKELMFADIVGIMNIRKNILFFSVSHYGYVNYGDFKLTVGYGRNFSDRFAMTARIFYLMAHARGYPARHSLCADFAFAYRVTPKVLLDAAVCGTRCYTFEVRNGVYVYACAKAVALTYDVEIASRCMGGGRTICDPSSDTATTRYGLLQ